jgi:hemerythrin-like metal-binding protein
MMTPHSVCLPWCAEYAAAVADIDAQHHSLLSVLNKLNNLAAGVDGGDLFGGGWLRNSFRDALRDLNEYAAYLFLREGELVTESPPATGRCSTLDADHRSYWLAIADLRLRFEAGEPDAAQRLITYLNRWWRQYLLEIDQRHGSFSDHSLTCEGAKGADPVISA